MREVCERFTFVVEPAFFIKSLQMTTFSGIFTTGARGSFENIDDSRSDAITVLLAVNLARLRA